MVRVIVERQLKHGEDIGRLLLELHMIAVQQKGHVSNETWINARNERDIAVLSTWQRIEDWNNWERSQERANILAKIEPLLAEDARIKIYEIMSPQDCEYYEDPGSWVQALGHPHFAG